MNSSIKIPQKLKTSLFIIGLILFSSCANSQETDMKYLASKNGVNLTQRHLEIYITMVTFGNETPTSKEELLTYKELLLEDFYNEPEKTVKDLEEHANMNKDYFSQERNEHQYNRNSFSSNDSFARVQQLLDPNGEFEASFTNQNALQLRNFLRGSVILREDSYAGSSDFGGGYTYQERITFCSNGTFTFVSISGASIDGGITHERINFEGLWTTFLQQGRLYIALHSEHQYVLQLNPKGMIPLWVKSYDGSAVRTASGENQDAFYRRESGSNCN